MTETYYYWYLTRLYLVNRLVIAIIVFGVGNSITTNLYLGIVTELYLFSDFLVKSFDDFKTCWQKCKSEKDYLWRYQENFVISNDAKSLVGNFYQLNIILPQFFRTTNHSFHHFEEILDNFLLKTSRYLVCFYSDKQLISLVSPLLLQQWQIKYFNIFYLSLS